jgi:hypothetical protein
MRIPSFVKNDASKRYLKPGKGRMKINLVRLAAGVRGVFSQ